MAEGAKKLPFGLSPATAGILGAVLLAALVYLAFPNLFAGKKAVPLAQKGPAPDPTAKVTTVSRATAPGTLPADASAVDATAATAAVAVDPEIETFNVRYGRANPFAAWNAGSARSAAVTANAGGSTALDKLSKQLSVLKAGDTLSNTDAATAAVITPVITANPDNTATNSSQAVEKTAAPPPDPLVLSGIVRLEGMAVAVIRQGNKGYMAETGKNVGKTGYTVLSIGDDRVTVISEDRKELELLLVRGKKA